MNQLKVASFFLPVIESVNERQTKGLPVDVATPNEPRRLVKVIVIILVGLLDVYVATTATIITNVRHGSDLNAHLEQQKAHKNARRLKFE